MTIRTLWQLSNVPGKWVTWELQQDWQPKFAPVLKNSV